MGNHGMHENQSRPQCGMYTHGSKIDKKGWKRPNKCQVIYAVISVQHTSPGAMK